MTGTSVPFTRRAGLLLSGLSLLGVVALLWPFVLTVSSSASQAHRFDAPIELMVLVPLLLLLCASELARGSFDVRAIAVLGILAACGTALRIPSPGVAGFEPMFFLLILAGFVYGPSFGFALGGLTLFVSALATGGIGPWLPFQMLAAGWVGLGAGFLPQVSHIKFEKYLLASYAVVGCILYGVVMNLWFWPFGIGSSTSISYVPGGALSTNIAHFFLFDVTTSLGFDIPRAVINAALILLLGGPVLVALRRGAHRVTMHPLDLPPEGAPRSRAPLIPE
ncbi:MAG: ECF transporter S component [Actinomycetes bacterium]